jgi:hypothetical protein
MKDLFGVEITELEYLQNEQSHGHFKKWKLMNRYRRSQNMGKKCSLCKFFKHGKYKKCTVMGVSSSTASDIRSGYVCGLFEINKREN